MNAPARVQQPDQMHLLVLRPEDSRHSEDPADLVQAIESAMHCEVLPSCGGKAAEMDSLAYEHWDVVLLDAGSSRSVTAERVAQLRACFEEVVFVVLAPTAEVGEMSVLAGADDYLVLPGEDVGYRIAAAVHRRAQSALTSQFVASLEADVNSLRELSNRDTLTGLRSRSAFISMVNRALSRTRR
ncbi:MAG: hypothetical protein AB8B93_16125, partial [Pseudomonadales bacterium]